MRRTLKKIMSLLLVLTLILGSGYSSYAQNTSIHLKTGDFPGLSSMNIYVYLDGHHGTPQAGVIEHVTVNAANATKLTMYKVGGSDQFDSTDLELDAEPIILHFEIGGYKYYVGTHIVRVGQEGGGTMNYKVKSMPSYTVSYDANTGSGTLPSIPKTYQVDATVTVLGNINGLYKTNHTFIGWNTAANGSGTSYVGGNTFKMGNANVVLYAQWSPNPTYTVTYDKNSDTALGTVPEDNTSYFTGNIVTVKSNIGDPILTNSGFSFIGWSRTANGMSGILMGGNTFNMGSSNVVLYAQWKPDNPTPTYYTLTYHANGGTVDVPPPITNLETSDTPEVGAPSANKYSNYKFMGWNLMADGSGNNYAPGSTITIFMSNLNLYAQWKPFYIVSYNGNGNTSGTTPNDDSEYFSNTEVQVLGSGNLVKTGHTFGGWNTQADGLGSTYLSTFIMGNANVTLYAIWTPDTTEPTVTTEPTTPEPTTPEPTTAAPTTAEPTTEEPPTDPPIIPTTEDATEELTTEPVPLSPARIINFDEPFDSSTFEEVVELEIEDTPLADALPQTGQLPVELFYGIGGLITAAGVFLKKK